MGFLNALPAIGSAIDAVTGLKNNRSAKKEAAANRQLQMDTLQNQIQWRVADAKKAGIHPMAALGFTGMSFTPSSTNFQDSTFGAVGQDISRAMAAGQTEAERRRAAGAATLAASQEAEYNQARIANMNMETELLRSQIARLNSAQVGPSLPAAGSVSPQPDRVTVGSPGAPERSPGVITDYSLSRTSNGYGIVPSADTKQRIEDNFMLEMGWAIRNNIVPHQNVVREVNRRHPPRPGYEWRWNALTQEFYQRPRSRAFQIPGLPY